MEIEYLIKHGGHEANLTDLEISGCLWLSMTTLKCRAKTKSRRYTLTMSKLTAQIQYVSSSNNIGPRTRKHCAQRLEITSLEGNQMSLILWLCLFLVLEAVIQICFRKRDRNEDYWKGKGEWKP